MEWVSGSFGSHVSYLYPSTILKGDNSTMEYTGITFAGETQNLDTGMKVVHIGKNTTSGSTQICALLWDSDAKAWTADVVVALAPKKDSKGKVLVPALVSSFRLWLPADDEGNVLTEGIEELPLD